MFDNWISQLIFPFENWELRITVEFVLEKILNVARELSIKIMISCLSTIWRMLRKLDSTNKVWMRNKIYQDNLEIVAKNMTLIDGNFWSCSEYGACETINC